MKSFIFIFILLTIGVVGLLVLLGSKEVSNPKSNISVNLEEVKEDIPETQTVVDNNLNTSISTTTNTLLTGTSTSPSNVSTNTKINLKAANMILFKTTKGDIKIKVHPEFAPKTTENFSKLVSSGFYNGTKFHRVIKGFMIQGGDPLSKDLKREEEWGRGGPGYKFEDEILDKSGKPKDVYSNPGYKRSVIAMANSGPNTNGSQFFIMHADYPLPPSYTIFAEVVGGMETVDAIAESKTMYPGVLDRPLENITILSAEIISEN